MWEPLLEVFIFDFIRNQLFAHLKYRHYTVLNLSGYYTFQLF